MKISMDCGSTSTSCSFTRTSDISRIEQTNWQTGSCLILKTTTLPIEYLNWVHDGSHDFENVLTQASRANAEKEDSRKQSLEICEEMIARIWDLDISDLAKQQMSNRLVKLRSKVLKRKTFSRVDLLKISEIESQIRIPCEPLVRYHDCSKQLKVFEESIPSLYQLGEKETNKRLEEFKVKATSSSRFRMPSLNDKKESGHQLRFDRSDWKWLYKKCTHMSLKNGMSSESNICVMGEMGTDIGKCLTVNLTGKETRYIIFESWALIALAQSFGIDPSCLTPSMSWQSCLQPLFDCDSNLEKSDELGHFKSLLERYERECEPQQSLILANQLAVAFEILTGEPALKHTQRHRFIFNGITLDHGIVRVSDELAWQIDQIGCLLGRYLESFANNMVSYLMLSEGMLCLEGDIVNKAINWSLEHLLNQNRQQGCAFFFGIDYSICGKSLQVINEGNYELILGDINLFPGGLGMFSQCHDSPLSELAHRDLCSIASGLAALVEDGPLGILVDSEAWLTNSRWSMEVRAIQQKYEQIAQSTTRIIPFFPHVDPRLSITQDSIHFCNESIGSVCWFLRDIYFSKASHFHVVSNKFPAVNHPFFMYALENKQILNQIIHKMAREHPELKIRIRNQCLIDISDFLNRYSLFTMEGENKLEAWLSLEKELVKLGKHLFIKPVLGKTFCPIYVNITSVPGLRTMRNFLEKCLRQGIAEVILEEMRPSLDETWLGQVGQHYSAELRCFYMRAAKNYDERV